jgi:pyruvate kinase
MAGHVRAAAATAGRPCKIAMDLGGPKLRTVEPAAGPRVIKIRPRRDQIGVVVEPARVVLHAGERQTADESAEGVPVVDREWIRRRQPGDDVRLVDARGRKRTWKVTDVADDSCTALATRTAYVLAGSLLSVGDDVVTVGDVPATDHVQRVRRDELVEVLRTAEPAVVGDEIAATAVVGCTLPEALEYVQVGERLWFDDGKIGGTVTASDDRSVTVTITDVASGGANLRGGKGINLPDSRLDLDALTEQDLIDLDVVVELADVVNVSFVRSAADVRRVHEELASRGADHVGVILKIENTPAFEALPQLLLEALTRPPVGVMIARGDLAVEVGFDRLAEVQEEIMWACEAAHVPVVWATQVLDTLAKTGQPSRAEISDAVLADRAECVMLNKGPHIADAIRALDSILRRMQAHQHKKRSLLRQLRSWSADPPE